MVLSAQDLRSEGAVVEHALCVIDREGGGADVAAAEGITLQALFTMSELEAPGPAALPPDPVPAVAGDGAILTMIVKMRRRPARVRPPCSRPTR